MPPEARIAVAGAKFWSGYQTAAWRELAGVRVVAVWKDGRIGTFRDIRGAKPDAP